MSEIKYKSSSGQFMRPIVKIVLPTVMLALMMSAVLAPAIPNVRAQANSIMYNGTLSLTITSTSTDGQTGSLVTTETDTGTVSIPFNGLAVSTVLDMASSVSVTASCRGDWSISASGIEEDGTTVSFSPSSGSASETQDAAMYGLYENGTAFFGFWSDSTEQGIPITETYTTPGWSPTNGPYSVCNPADVAAQNTAEACNYTDDSNLDQSCVMTTMPLTAQAIPISGSWTSTQGDWTLTWSGSLNITPAGESTTNPASPMDQTFYQNQGAYSNLMGSSTKTLSNSGCAITSAAMVFDYYYYLTQGGSKTHVNPSDLNAWLTNNGGYDGNTAGVFFTKLLEYANSVLGLQLAYTDLPGTTVALDYYLGQNVPVILQILYQNPTSGKIGTHFVVATGTTIDGSGNPTYTILDPGHQNVQLLSGYNNLYNNAWQVVSARVFTSTSSKAQGSVTIGGQCPIQLLLTDPSGNQTGFDATANSTIFGIPNSNYFPDQTPDECDADLTPTIEVTVPTAGTYNLTVIGTGAGNYTIDILMYDQSGNPRTEQINGTATPSSIQTYPISYGSDAPNASATVPEFPEGARGITLTMSAVFFVALATVAVRRRIRHRPRE